MGRLNVRDEFAVANHVLEPTRLNALLQTFIDRSDEAQAGRREQLKQLRTRMTSLEGESANVIKLVRLGTMAADDPQIETELGNIGAQKRAVAADIESAQRQLGNGTLKITPEVISKFGDLIASKLRDPKELGRRDYLRLLVDRVEVGHREIRMSGSKRPLSQVVMGMAPSMVPEAERKWCARVDSNHWPQD
ncbi:MAG: hypothetical protein JWO15_2983 [Sphingomonadales bacterium]|nr:hypothetical protein [Sphingomonadales bacterium]